MSGQYMSLHEAAKSGDVDKVRELLEDGKYDVNCTDYRGWTPLHYACSEGHVGVVRELIESYSADVECVTSKCQTPLHVAAYYGYKEVAFLIIEFDCDVTVKGYIGRSVLHSACRGGNVDLVRTILLEHGADPTARDDQNDTPLNVAARFGQKEAVLALINEFDCDVTVKGFADRSVLHDACQGGNVDLVRTILLEHGAGPTARDDQNDTPLNVAARFGQKEAVLALINEFDCDVTVKGFADRSVLHDACQGGNVDLVRTLILEHGADPTARDDQNNTPLNLAAFFGQNNAALALINEFDCNVTVKSNLGRSVLHDACEGGNVDLVRTLILEHGADPTARDDKNNTPLNVAAFSGQKNAALALINEFDCSVTVKGNVGRSVLHNACEGGNVDLVRTLILEHGADPTARDDQNNTPLNLAAFSGQKNAALALINEFDCSVTVKNNVGRSVLHDACLGGNVDLVRTLILKHGADPTARDDQNNTPLNLAAFCGQKNAALALINEFHCSVTVKGNVGRSVLHNACEGGNVDLVCTLILEHGAGPTARDDENSTPLHVAARFGQKEAALALINKFHCDITVTNNVGRSVLHHACEGGNVDLVRTLILEHGADPTARDDQNNTPLHVAAKFGRVQVSLALIEEFHASLVDSNKDGDTPLHLCAARGYTTCVKALLSANAPILLRNRSGKTSKDVATGSVISFFKTYIKENRDTIYSHYKSLMLLAKKKHSFPERITRIFVIGKPGVGKSTLVENLKRDKFFNIRRISESSVPPHTAGIVPSIFSSKHYGRVLFFDFAGDPEYYSSHAAILENLASSVKGDNIFIIVVDLREERSESEKSLHYWLSFIQYQEYPVKMPFVIVVGSHFDVLPLKEIQLKHKFIVTFLSKATTSAPLIVSSYFFIDCGTPNSPRISRLRRQIKDLTKKSPRYDLSSGARILLGLLEKDFSNVTTCSIQSIVSHIESTGVHLPTKLQLLSSLLHELHCIGLLLCSTRSTRRLSLQSIVVLNISQLTNEVHKCLFSLEAKTIINEISILKGLTSDFNLGIIPESVLQEILPGYIPKECLIQLQYCQEISFRDLCVFPGVASSTANSTFLYFPALCIADKSDVSWTTNDYSIGWLARCTDPHDSFPPRFLHVLLLRLVFRFALPLPTANQDLSVSPDHSFFQRRCTMWKTGVHWRMAEGVECLVELVGTNQVVVITKSDEDLKENCVSVFNRLINCVMEAKAEFCHSIRPQFFLLDSTDPASYLSDSNLFAIKEVEEALNFSSKEAVVSLDGKKFLKRQRCLFLRKLTHWDSLFPFEFSSVLLSIEDVFRLFDLGICLKIRDAVLESIERISRTDIAKARRELVREWLSSSLDPPCWWHLIEALRDAGRNDIAKTIEKKYGLHVHLEKILLSAKESLKPDERFLEEFAGVVESKWPSLASILSLTSAEIGEVRRKEELSQRDFALQMLRQWARREDATFGQLRQRLKTVSLFQYTQH